MADKTFLEFSQELPENEAPALTDKVIGIQGEENLQTEIGDYKTLLSGDKIPKPETPSNGDTLVYNSTTEAWEAAPTVLTTPDSNIISIDNNSNTDVLTDYQIKVNVTYNSGMKADFSDLRFWDIYDSTKLDYWIQSKIDGVSAIVWVKVPFIPASSSTKIIMKYGDAFAESESDGAATFPLGFDDFINHSHHQFPFGSDGGWASGFDPVSRRFYFFGLASDGYVNYRVTPWVNIDTWEVGYVQPPFVGNSMGVCYHAGQQLFYIYNSSNSGVVNLNQVYTFNPATEVFTLLPVTMIQPTYNPSPCYDPVSGKIFLFGGRLTINPNTFIDTIAVHDVVAGTITDTGANLYIAMDGPTPTYCDVDQRIYLFGGAYESSGTKSSDKIYKYNPATPGTNPVDTGTVMADGRDTRGAACVNGVFYLFGGYSYTLLAYTNRIDKYNSISNTIETIEPTMYCPDDDMLGFYDTVTGKVFVGPVLHQSNTDPNSDNHKVFVMELDPTNDFLYPSTPFNTLPSGWTNLSTTVDTTVRPRLVGNTYCTFPDYLTTSFVGIKRAYSALSGVVRIDASVSVGGNGGGGNAYNFIVAACEPDVVGATLLTKAVFRIRCDNNFNILANDTTIAAAGNGEKEWSMILNFNGSGGNGIGYGLLNDANKTAPLAFMNSAIGKTINTIYIATGTGMFGAAAVDWVRVRKSTIGIEPTATVID